MKLLTLEDLVTVFRTSKGDFAAVDGVSFEMDTGETVGVVGESGSGKTVTALSIMQLVNDPPGKIVNGRILFCGQNLLTYKERQMQQIRGNQISMIFQEPLTSLNPAYTIGNQIMEVIMKHKKATRKEAYTRSVELLEKVGIPMAKKRMTEYPHQFSGGMRQRVMIAIALACQPRLLIADEPTTALDVTIQAQILDLMRTLREEFKMAMLLVSHDLGVVAEMADRVVVMYAGKVVEQAKVTALFQQPLHPYTQGLLKALPDLKVKSRRLYSIPGQIAEPLHLPKGCRFSPRCEFAREKCSTMEPPLILVNSDRLVRCWLHIRE